MTAIRTLHALRRLTLATTAALFAAGASAQDFEPLSLNVVGNVTNIPQSTEIEGPVFNGLEKKSGGKIKVRFRTFQELGMKGDEMAPSPRAAASTSSRCSAAT